jgi:hypothetical protein
MKIKPSTPNPNPKALLKRRFLNPATICHPFQAWIQAASLPESPGEPRVEVALQPMLPDVALEQLSSRVVQAVRAAPPSLDPHKVLVTFNSGWLQGVTCTVVVAGRRVRLRLRADGARQRADLQQSQKILAGRLRSAGFDLCGFGVSS